MAGVSSHGTDPGCSVVHPFGRWGRDGAEDAWWRRWLGAG